MEHSLLLEVPLPTHEQAMAIYNTLRPDPDLKPQEFMKTLSVDGSYVVVRFGATTERTLRLGVNSFMDVLSEALECMSTFDPHYYKE